MPVPSTVIAPLGRLARHLPHSWRTLRGAVLAIVLLVCLAVFVGLADAAAENDDIAALDPVVTDWAVAERRSPVTSIAWFVTHAGGTLGLTLLTLLVTGVLLLRRRRTEAAVLLAAMMGSSFLTVLLKLVFGRARPSVDLLLGAPSASYSFPSGHSLNTTVFVGALAGFVAVSAAPLRRKAAAGLAAVVVAGLVGMSRIYLAYHWLTDVLAGWALGVAWLCVVALVTLAVLERRGSHQAYTPSSHQRVERTSSSGGPSATTTWR